MKRGGTCLYRGDTLIYLFDGKECGSPLVVKKPADVHPPPHVINALNNEFEILNHLSVNGVRRALKKEQEEGKPVLLLEYIKGETLQEYIHRTHPNLLMRLQIALGLSFILMKIHDQRIVYNDMNSRNVLVPHHEQSIVLIDFGSAFHVPGNVLHGNNIDYSNKNYSGEDYFTDYSKDSILYVSPEKTGHVRRSIDFRSDLYSLGVVFYELFTEKLPFISDDPQELVYKHIAEEPAEPRSINPEIPRVMNNMILKLMNKNAADRYQSAPGLNSDLDACAVQLQKKKKIVAFPLAQKDHPSSLIFPQKLYGREKEMQFLHDAFRKASAGESQLLLVSGYEGVGKTSLIRKFRNSLSEKQTLFFEGKYDKQSQSVPYTGIAQAFHEFVSFVLGQPEEEFNNWKQKLVEASGKLGKVLTNIIPRLELIIGKQKEVPNLSGPEAYNRLFYVFKRFVKTILFIRTPCVIFLDDLQLVDNESLHLFKSMISTMDLRGLFLIGAFRDNEVYGGHPLVRTMNELEKESIDFHTLAVKNLRKAHIVQLLRDTLNPCERVEELSSILFHKARGNPFFTRRILKSLHENNYIMFDINAEKWKWDRHAIRSLKITDIVAELLEERLLSLDSDTKNVLTVAACVGRQFVPSEGAVVSDQSEYEVVRRLNEAVQTLSLETDLESLLDKMMSIVMENGGADRALLFLKQNNEWYIKATGDFREKQFDVFLNNEYIHEKDCADGIECPERVINLCLRTGEIVTWNEDSTENEVTRDSYIVEKHIKSLLCIPLKYKAELNGVLYLENSLTPNVFHDRQIETLNVLSSQLSISLENALLYRSIAESLEFERLLSELSAAFVNLQTDMIDEKIIYWLKRLVSFLGADRGAIFEFKEEDALFCLSHYYNEPHVAKPPVILKHFSWLAEKMHDGQMIVLKNIDDLPEDAQQEKQHLFKEGIRACIVLPMVVGNSCIGVLDFAFLHREKNWTQDFLQRLRILEQIFAHTLARKKSEEKLQKRTRELQETAEKLKHLSEHLQEVREHERASIAREIHDDLGQALTVLKMDASWMDKHLQDDTESLRMKIKEMTVFIDETIKTVQRLSSELRPQILDILGLFAAVEWQMEEFQKREGISYRLTCEGEEMKNEKCDVVLFRVLQEALTNITRHARATEVDVLLKMAGGFAKLEISDNGRGIAQNKIHSKSSLGLMGIRERVSFLNGTFKIIGRKNRGTTLTVSIPVSRERME
jgi:signal transduction histidine kinase/serine/threonine protein kinase